MTIDQAIVAVMKSAPDTRTLHAAKQYAESTAEAVRLYGMLGLEAQARGVLNNLTSWRGEEALKVKAALGAFLTRPDRTVIELDTRCSQCESLCDLLCVLDSHSFFRCRECDNEWHTL
jgi:hypothetical protein